jgi:hypothetical protein
MFPKPQGRHGINSGYIKPTEKKETELERRRADPCSNNPTTPSNSSPVCNKATNHSRRYATRRSMRTKLDPCVKTKH